MEPAELTGTYTYRSFLNRPQMVDDFNTLRFAQLALELEVTSEGVLSGELVFGEDPRVGMLLTGTVTGTSSLHLVYTGRGRPDSDIADFHYDYDAILLPTWKNGIGQIATLAGTVVRAADHGTPPNVAKAGATASFLAVRRGN